MKKKDRGGSAVRKEKYGESPGQEENYAGTAEESGAQEGKRRAEGETVCRSVRGQRPGEELLKLLIEEGILWREEKGGGLG